ncbi:carbohydrate-binding module family 18 protein [Diplogelasinospora grovesii]|uniref:Carbohydrate-binding module family 18 protein n=1 Tax=Diplogelasinospora grovesii TaxID=303347 RepID=A0AAN6NCR7_9PEZI|nr:carbohydrate-binding module family 18 protein [Diplogelasinospora grovesii]
MVSSTLLLLASAFMRAFAAPEDTAACTRSTTAQKGDTCATLASAAGITVGQFLQSNPYITSCSNLVVGGSYCVEGIQTSGPTAPPSSPSPSPSPSSNTPPAPSSSGSGGPLKVSADGTCGTGVTCAGSRYGSCCSEHGFCGSTSDYCGAGCQVGLGQCSGSSPPPVSSQPVSTTPPPVGVTTTATTTVTRTLVVTSTNIVTATTTNTVQQTGTVVATQTTRVTVLVTSTVLSTSVAVSTSVKTVTSTKEVTRTSTSVEINTLTTITTLTVTTCGGGGPTITSIWPTSGTPSPTFSIIPTTRPPPITSITSIIGAPPPAQPSPILPGTSSSCRSYDLVKSGDSCRKIANRNNLALLDFYKMNPSVSANVLSTVLCVPGLLDLLLKGLCQIDCDNLWAGYYVCVG